MTTRVRPVALALPLVIVVSACSRRGGSPQREVPAPGASGSGTAALPAAPPGSSAVAPEGSAAPPPPPAPLLAARPPSARVAACMTRVGKRMSDFGPSALVDLRGRVKRVTTDFVAHGDDPTDCGQLALATSVDQSPPGPRWSFVFDAGGPTYTVAIAAPGARPTVKTGDTVNVRFSMRMMGKYPATELLVTDTSDDVRAWVATADTPNVLRAPAGLWVGPAEPIGRLSSECVDATAFRAIATRGPTQVKKLGWAEVVQVGPLDVALGSFVVDDRSSYRCPESTSSWISVAAFPHEGETVPKQAPPDADMTAPSGSAVPPPPPLPTGSALPEGPREDAAAH
jgi:hypothetical protein